MKLTQSDRNQIVRAAIAAQFDPIDERRKADKKALHLEVYRAIVPTGKEVSLHPLVNEGWVGTTKGLSVHICGQHHFLNFDEPHPYPTSDNLKSDDPSLAESLSAYDRRKDAEHAQRQKAHSTLSAFLKSFTTFEKLAAAWPEGQRFYDPVRLQAGETGTAIAVTSSDINTLLGIAS